MILFELATKEPLTDTLPTLSSLRNSLCSRVVATENASIHRAVTLRFTLANSPIYLKADTVAVTPGFTLANSPIYLKAETVARGGGGVPSLVWLISQMPHNWLLSHWITMAHTPARSPPRPRLDVYYQRHCSSTQ